MLLLVVAAVASVSCLLTARWSRAQQPNHADAHRWIHTQLELTAQQEQELVPIEARYEEQRRQFRDLVRAANAELAQALLADEGESPRVKAAIAKIHDAQGQFQNATARHVFEMKPVLKPEQYRKLLDLTANALYQVDHAH